MNRTRGREGECARGNVAGMVWGKTPGNARGSRGGMAVFDGGVRRCGGFVCPIVSVASVSAVGLIG
ncbi:MAG: hypothetical protein MI923_20625 [Phycisphaerales bacterium]|nr:hypothetical protein [Phycisphaerales bacterium]